MHFKYTGYFVNLGECPDLDKLHMGSGEDTQIRPNARDDTHIWPVQNWK